MPTHLTLQNNQPRIKILMVIENQIKMFQKQVAIITLHLNLILPPDKLIIIAKENNSLNILRKKIKTDLSKNILIPIPDLLLLKRDLMTILTQGLLSLLILIGMMNLINFFQKQI